MEEILAIVLIFGGGTLFALSMSPLGRAVADRIRGAPKPGSLTEEDLDQLRDAQMAIVDDMEAMRQEMSEINERVDFAERMLAQKRDVGALPNPVDD